jgi:hypothetical protein
MADSSFGYGDEEMDTVMGEVFRSQGTHASRKTG